MSSNLHSMSESPPPLEDYPDSPPPLDDFPEDDDEFSDFTTATTGGHDFDDTSIDDDTFSDQPLPQIDSSSGHSSPLKSLKSKSVTPEINGSEMNANGKILCALFTPWPLVKGYCYHFIVCINVCMSVA